MCGIIGSLNQRNPNPVAMDVLLRMLETIQHRGPDGMGIFRDEWIGMGNARLSIIDLQTGDQPIGNEDGSMWIVFNGEIFNYIELRADLEKHGHAFSTHTDTEVILHLYEEEGPACLHKLNGQFAFAIWNRRDRVLFLARDRVGVRPLFYTHTTEYFLFASEIKAFLAHPDINLSLDTTSLAQTFTYWAPLSPRTAFENISELPPGHYLLLKDGDSIPVRYWYPVIIPEEHTRPAGEYLEEFEALLQDAVRIRLRADVPVGAYLSGGLDSSTTTALIRKLHQNRLDTFSITFADPNFDESIHQRRMASYLNTENHTAHCTDTLIGEIFPEVIRHTEAPILRTAPAPMLLLSRLVRQYNFKVVLTGEGADEFLAGYDIFKEMKIRRFWAATPDSTIRPQLIFRLYPDINRLASSGAFLIGFFRRSLLETSSPYYSHLIRWNNTGRTRRFLSTGEADEPGMPPLPEGFKNWNALNQAQYLEITTFLSPYLLSSQGDRMAMANSVEGRYPFLDVRVMEFCNRLPVRFKMPGLSEKWLLRQVGKKYLPDEIWQRLKRPYRAPIHRSFFTPQPLNYVQDLLSEQSLNRSGIFESAAVLKLRTKALSNADLSEVEEMALVGILSTQLLVREFLHHKPVQDKLPEFTNLKVVDFFHAGEHLRAINNSYTLSE